MSDDIEAVRARWLGRSVLIVDEGREIDRGVIEDIHRMQTSGIVVFLKGVQVGYPLKLVQA
jgi:hypothetical protein